AWHGGVLPWLAGRAGALGTLLAAPPRALAVLGLLIVPTNVYLFTWRLTELRRHEGAYYLRQGEGGGLNWLADHTGPGDVVLSRLEIGQFVPNYGATRAFLAHWAMTDRFFQRRDEADRFFSAETPDAFRRQLLDRDGVTLILHTPGDAGA